VDTSLHPQRVEPGTYAGQELLFLKINHHPLEYILFIVALLLHCGIKQPVEQIVTVQEGEIIIHSAPPGARIFLDRQNTNFITPDTLIKVPIGSHLIQVFLEGYRAIPDSMELEVAASQSVIAAFQMQKIETSGFLIITSSPANAEIYIDGHSCGFHTPDTLTLETGQHNIELRKNGYAVFLHQVDIAPGGWEKLEASLTIQPCILLEAFGNVSCTPCVEAAHNLHQFSQNHSADQYALIEYYANWPSPNDPFYKEAPQDAMQRITYYQLTALPSLFIGGSMGVDATRYDDILAAFQTMSSNPSASLGLSVDKNLSAGQLAVTVELYASDDSLFSSELRLFVAIIENSIHFETAPGSNGLIDFDNVFRGFLSERTGDSLSADSEQIFQYEKIWPAWDFAQAHIVAFLQNMKTKTIVHCTIN
jgi:hypothetical protein